MFRSLLLVALLLWQLPAAPTNVHLSPVASSTGAHAWFDAQRARPTVVVANGLRSQADIERATKGGPPNVFFTYVWPNDSHAERQDGAKLILPALSPDGTVQASLPGNQQLVFDLNVTSGTLIVSWEFYFTHDWQVAFTEQAGEDWGDYKYKMFQLTHSGTKIFFETRMRWNRGARPAYVATHDIRNYDMGTESAQAWGVVNPSSYIPTGERAVPNVGGGGLNIPVSQWLRFYKEFRIGVDASAFTSWNTWRPTLVAKDIPAWAGPLPPGKYSMLSEYIAGETFDPVCVLDRVPATYKPGGNIGKFMFELNTSSARLRHGTAVGYGRNVVAWLAAKGLDDDPSSLSRPKR